MNACMKKTSRQSWGLLDYVAGGVLLLVLGSLVPKETVENVYFFPNSVRAATFNPDATYTAHRAPVGSILLPQGS